MQALECQKELTLPDTSSWVSGGTGSKDIEQEKKEERRRRKRREGKEGCFVLSTHALQPGPSKPRTGTPATHRLRKVQSASVYWLSTNFYSWEIICSHCVRCVTVIDPKSSTLYFTGHSGWLLHEFNARVWWLAFCEFYLTCRISAYYIRNKGFSFNIISVSHFWVHGAGAWFTIWPVWLVHGSYRPLQPLTNEHSYGKDISMCVVQKCL